MYFPIITLLCIPYLMVRPIMFYYVNLSQRLNFSFIFWLVLARQLEAVTNSGFKLKHIIPNQSDKPGSMQKKNVTVCEGRVQVKDTMIMITHLLFNIQCI